MRFLIVVIFAVITTACAQTTALTSKPGEADLPSATRAFETLGDAAPDGAATAAELDAVKAAFASAGLVFGAIEPNEGGAVIKDAVLRFPGDVEAGLNVAELRLWGLDAAALAAFAADGGAPNVAVAKRLEARGVKGFGLEALIQSFMDGYTDTLSAVTPGITDENRDAAMELLLSAEFETYDLAVDRIILDGLVLYRPEAADETAPLWRQWLTLNRMFSVERGAAYGVTASSKYVQALQSSELIVDIPLQGFEGLRRGDIDLSLIKDMTFSMRSVISESAAEPFAMDMAYKYDLFAVEGLRASKLLQHLAAGKTPPMSETDLLSLGVWRIFGETQSLNGVPFYNVEETYADVSRFHWLIPTEAVMTSRGVTYDVGGLLSYLEQMMPAGDADAFGPETGGLFESIAGSLKTNGLDVLAGDITASWEYDPKDGATELEQAASFSGLGAAQMDLEALLPAYNKLAAFEAADGAAVDWNGVGALFMTALALEEASVELEDAGGLEKVIGVAIDLAKLQPTDNQVAAMIRNSSAEEVRVLLGSILRASSAAVASMFPPAMDYADAVATFIEQGGTLAIAAEPQKPVGQAEIEAFMATSGGDLSGLPELLGLSVTHDAAN